MGGAGCRWIGFLPASSQTSHAAGNVAYWIIGAVLIAPALSSQVRRPQRKIAPLQQVAVVAIAFACAALASGVPIGIAGAAVVLVPLVVVLALHPGRSDVLRRPRRPSIPLLVIAAAVVPALAYAWKMASNGRADLPPEDSFAYVPSLWSAVVAMALATVLVAVLAAFRSPGWRVSGTCAAAAAFLFGITSIVNPGIPASGGRVWGAAAIVWSLALMGAAARERSERV